MAKSSIQIFASALAKKHKITIAEATTFVNAVFDIITEELKSNNQVKIKGLGTFKVQKVKPRESVNVNTGERVLIEGHDKISFTPDAAMKELVNKPFSQFETVILNEGVNFDDEESSAPADESQENAEEKAVEEQKLEEAPAKEAVSKESTALVLDVPNSGTEPKDAISEAPEALKEEEDSTHSAAEDGDIAEPLPLQEDVSIPVQEKEEEQDEEEKDAVSSASGLEENAEVEEKESDSSTSNNEKSVAEEETEEQEKAKTSLPEEENAETENVIPVEAQANEAVPTPLEASRAQEEKGQSKMEDKPVAEEKTKELHVDLDDDDDVSTEDRTLWLMLKVIGAVLLFIIIFFVGRAFLSNSKNTKVEVAQEKTEANAPTANKESKKTGSQSATRPVTPQASVAGEQAESNANEFLKLSNDPRIRYGAYNIIGIEKVVVLKKGQTMRSYSRKALGPGMEGYFQVLNGKDEMGPGDTLKVPKVEYRPQYQNRK